MMKVFFGMNTKVFFFIAFQSSATTNETLSDGSDITTAMKIFFPSIQDTDIEALITVCKAYSESEKVSKFYFLLIQAYPVSDFAFSADLRFQTLTGDSQFRCAVSPDHHLSGFFLVQQGSHQFSLSLSLAGDHGRNILPKCYIMGLSVQPEKSHFRRNRCLACR